MNELTAFEKHWITVTLAPDSIRRIKSTNTSALHVIRNEQTTKFMLIVENSTIGVVGYGENYEQLKQHRPVTNSEMTSILAKHFNLSSFKC